jgi:hypothetical protein
VQDQDETTGKEEDVISQEDDESTRKEEDVRTQEDDESTDEEEDYSASERYFSEPSGLETPSKYEY